MSADDRLKVIARHIGAARNNIYPSVVRHLCSSESQSLESVRGGVALTPIGRASDAQKQVHSVIPKNRYECLVGICFELNRIYCIFLSV
jgi:hypothetical protein